MWEKCQYSRLFDLSSDWSRLDHQPLLGKGEGRPHTRERRTSSLWLVTLVRTLFKPRPLYIGGNFGFVWGKLGQKNNYRDVIFFETLRVFKMFPSGFEKRSQKAPFSWRINLWTVGRSSNSSGVVSDRALKWISYNLFQFSPDSK